MTEQELHVAILEAERVYDETLRKIICRRGGAFEKYPQLVYYDGEATGAATLRDRTIHAAEFSYYKNAGLLEDSDAVL